MTDLNKLRSEFESDLADHLIERDANGFYINDEIQNYWEKHLLKAQIKELKAELEKAKAQAVPVWISVEDKLPEIADASVLAHFQNGSIETVHIEDWFKDITSGFDEAGIQTFTKWYLKASNTITHWMSLPEAPIETGA
ncbi:TPA: DUF551 domain-containing protein [Acinetobacter baumannii]|nr:DUF551 domain-containing protein [Acinetobacter baumannii]HEE6552984.1 DUF551 domain-containing protein [Acinetobacter baumannii]